MTDFDKLETNEDQHVTDFVLPKAKRIKTIKMINQLPSEIELIIKVDLTRDLTVVAQKKNGKNA